MEKNSEIIQEIENMFKSLYGEMRETVCRTNLPETLIETSEKIDKDNPVVEEQGE